MKKKSKKKATVDKLDKMWSDLVKRRAGYRCEHCGNGKYLNAHHIFSRSNYSTRWDLTNGIALCPSCHTFSSKFSAHLTPAEFIEWIKETRGADWYHFLRANAKDVYKPEYEKIKTKLEEISLHLP